MKNRVLIIEDNYYKFFTTKQVLDAQLKLNLDVNHVKTGQELAEVTAGFKPDQIIYRPNGGVADLLMSFKKRNINRRNTEVTILLTNELDELSASMMEEFIARATGSVAEAA